MNNVKPGVLKIMPRPFEVSSKDRENVVKHLSTFMNECLYGACGNEGEDAKDPDEFEVATLTAMRAIHDIAFASYHRSQKRAAIQAIVEEIKQFNEELS